MEHVDRMKPQVRALVHEYGYVIVQRSLDDMDTVDVDALTLNLETWRERRRAELLR